MKTEWNYSELAKPYLNRPNYSEKALEKLFEVVETTMDTSELNVCDVGAGVAHLTIPLLERGYKVDAVEPNDEMRKLGSWRTENSSNVRWYEGTGEDTGRSSEKYDFVTFGSSFNVTDRMKALSETARILKPSGWFACMWNHRDLEDSIQSKVERIIKKTIPQYSYGSRREDQTEVINSSDLFHEVQFADGDVTHNVDRNDWVNAWRSHATLARQAGDNFEDIILEIDNFLKSESLEKIVIPYKTRIWFAQKKS